MPKAVVTGIGLWTGLGVGREATWEALKAGRSALRWIDVPGLGGNGVAGAPSGAVVADGEDATLTLLAHAAREALDHAGLGAGSPYQPERVATLIGLSKGCVRRLASGAEAMSPPPLWGRTREGGGRPCDAAAGRSRPAPAPPSPALAHKGGGRKIRPLEHGPRSANVNGSSPFDAWPDLYWPNAGALAVADLCGARGPCLAPVAACATGLVAALQAADLIRRGVCDVALAGAADASLDPLILGAFRNMGVLAHAEGDPARALRPWDRKRDGFLVGEGAAVLVLEGADKARARGARIYAELAGGACGADAYHPTALNPDPTGLADLILRALRNAGVRPAEIDLVNVHGTATPANDPLECRALRLALGEYAEGVSCTANKSQIGHLLGAAGAAELAITCLAVRDGFVPPTLNLDDPDPACDLDGTPHLGRARPVGAALKLSIGFGGHLAAAVVRRVGYDGRYERPARLD